MYSVHACVHTVCSLSVSVSNEIDTIKFHFRIQNELAKKVHIQFPNESARHCMSADGTRLLENFVLNVFSKSAREQSVKIRKIFFLEKIYFLQLQQGTLNPGHNLTMMTTKSHLRQTTIFIFKMPQLVLCSILKENFFLDAHFFKLRC